MPVMRIFASGTLRGGASRAINSFATQNKSVSLWGHQPLDLVIVGTQMTDSRSRNDARTNRNVWAVTVICGGDHTQIAYECERYSLNAGNIMRDQPCRRTKAGVR
jgi:hypothetical protein